MGKGFEQKCEKCGYEWVSRIEKPVSCPKCKRYDFNIVGARSDYHPRHPDAK